MSLIHVHRFLIAIGTIFCLAFGIWEFDAAISGGGGSAFILGTVFVLFGILLGVYLKNMDRVLGHHR